MSTRMHSNETLTSEFAACASALVDALSCEPVPPELNSPQDEPAEAATLNECCSEEVTLDEDETSNDMGMK